MQKYNFYAEFSAVLPIFIYLCRMKKSIVLLIAFFSLWADAFAQYVTDYDLMKARPHVLSRMMNNPWTQARFFGPVVSVIQTNQNYDTTLLNSIFENWKNFKQPYFSRHYRWTSCNQELAVYHFNQGKSSCVTVHSYRENSYQKVHFYKKKKSNGVARRTCLPWKKERVRVSEFYSFDDGRPQSRTTVDGNPESIIFSGDNEQIIYDSLQRPCRVLYSNYILHFVFDYTYNGDNEIVKEDIYDYTQSGLRFVTELQDSFLICSTSYFYENGKCTKTVVDMKERSSHLDGWGDSIPISYEVLEGPYGPICYKSTGNDALAGYGAHGKYVPGRACGLALASVSEISLEYDCYGNLLSKSYKVDGNCVFRKRWEYTYDSYGNWLTRNYYEGDILRQHSERDINYQ